MKLISLDNYLKVLNRCKNIKNVRKNSSIKSKENNEELVEVDLEIFQEIKSVFTQKGRYGFIKIK